MMSEWLGIPAALLAWGFASYVFIMAPPTRGARFLVAMLIIDGLAVISSYGNWVYVDRFLTETLGMVALPGGLIHQASDWALIAVYLPFLGMTLDSPLVAPLKRPVISAMIMVGGLAIALSILFLSDATSELFRVPFYFVICIVLAWGFAAALHSWYIATSEAKRERAGRAQRPRTFGIHAAVFLCARRHHLRTAGCLWRIARTAVRRRSAHQAHAKAQHRSCRFRRDVLRYL